MNTGLVGFEERIQTQMTNLCRKAAVRLYAFCYRLLSQEKNWRNLISELLKNTLKTTA